MDNLVDYKLFNNIYKDRKVFITGHTGFKGSWLAYWLYLLGARVYGYSKDIPTDPSHYSLLEFDHTSIKADILDIDTLTDSIKNIEPEIVFHLAAQPLVRLSYKEPISTLETNIIGTANILEACRGIKSVKAIVNVTSDKCYENKETEIGYSEIDPMGGFDPYSASKGCSELITSAYRNSFFNLNDFKKTHQILVASARAGNVIGGGDWAMDRLIPDLVVHAKNNKTVNIRYPEAVRPWQHVLEPLGGYLLLGKTLLEGKKEYAEAWNFGPLESELITVKEILELSKKIWNNINYAFLRKDDLHEAGLLNLNCAKANNSLQWCPLWKYQLSVQKTIEWYMNYYERGEINTYYDIKSYIDVALTQKCKWIKST